MKIRMDLKSLTVYRELREAILPLYQQYLDNFEGTDSYFEEAIRADMASGDDLELNAYTAQHFVVDLDEKLRAKKKTSCLLFKAIKHFYVCTGIYIDFEEGIVYSSKGRPVTAQPDFMYEGRGYQFNGILQFVN